jgi:hypothetical protein
LPLFREAFAKTVPDTRNGLLRITKRSDGKQPYRFHRKISSPRLRWHMGICSLERRRDFIFGNEGKVVHAALFQI